MNDTVDTVTGQEIAFEYERLNSAINDGSYREQHNKLYAARQALGWALNPKAAASPYDTIMGNWEVSKDCPVECHPPQS